MPDGLFVALADGSGGEVPFYPPKLGGAFSHSSHPPRTLVHCGHWKMPAAGKYTLTATPALEKVPEPKQVLASAYPKA